MATNNLYVETVLVSLWKKKKRKYALQLCDKWSHGEIIYIFFSLFLRSLFIICLDSGSATSSCPNLKYAYVYSLVFFVPSTFLTFPSNFSCTQSTCGCVSDIKSRSRSFSKYILNVLTRAWMHTKGRVPHTCPFLIFLLKPLVPVGDRKLSKKVLGLEVFQRCIAWLNLGKFSQVW